MVKQPRTATLAIIRFRRRNDRPPYQVRISYALKPAPVALANGICRGAAIYCTPVKETLAPRLPAVGLPAPYRRGLTTPRHIPRTLRHSDDSQLASSRRGRRPLGAARTLDYPCRCGRGGRFPRSSQEKS